MLAKACESEKSSFLAIATERCMAGTLQPCEQASEMAQGFQMFRVECKILN